MTREDRERWNAKWAERSTGDMAVCPLLVRYEEHLTGGAALDVACGLGQNALWLAARNYRVTAVDISPVALAKGRAEAERRNLSIEWVEVDLDRYVIPKETFDTIVVTRFLDRVILPSIEKALRPGGWLFYQTWNTRRLETRPDFSPEFLLSPGELEEAFAGLQIIEADDAGELSHIVCQRR